MTDAGGEGTSPSMDGSQNRSVTLHDTVTAALAAARETLAGGTPGPWQHVRVPFRDTASHSIKVGSHVLGLVGWEREEPDRAPADAALIVAAVNSLDASLDLVAMVVEGHAPRDYCTRDNPDGCTTVHCKCFSDWPCALYRQAAAALGVVCDE